MNADERKTAAAIQSALTAKYLARALEALEANHENHQIHDDHGSYPQSELERKNIRAIHGLRMTIGWLAAKTTAQESTTAEKGQPVGSEALLDAVAHLAGAASAYRTYAKRHASLGKVPRDALFTTRAADFEAAALRGHAAVKVALAAEGAYPTAQPAPQTGTADPKRQYFYKNNKCESYNSSKSSCICWHDEGTGPFAEGRSGLTWREKPIEQPQPAPQARAAEQQKVLGALIDLARIVDRAVEDWGESFADGSSEVRFHKEEAEKRDAILDYFDSLPDASDENVIESGPLKAARIMRASAVQPQAGSGCPCGSGDDGLVCPRTDGTLLCEPAAKGTMVPVPQDKATQDQVAAVLLQHGSPAQQEAALCYAASEPPTGAERLAEVRDAIMAYHLALDQREHGGKAAGIAIYAIEEALGMPWIQGQAAALKKAQGDDNG